MDSVDLSPHAHSIASAIYTRLGSIPVTTHGVNLKYLGNTGFPNEGLEGGCLERRPPAQFAMHRLIYH